MGSNMKIGVTTADVQSYGVDETGSNSDTKNAVAILPGATGIQIEATLAHGANFDATYVRTRCADGQFSAWVKVAK
jgi:hypothetical protein